MRIRAEFAGLASDMAARERRRAITATTAPAKRKKPKRNSPFSRTFQDSRHRRNNDRMMDSGR